MMFNMDGISIYTKTYVTTDSDQIGQMNLAQEELRIRRIGHDAMMEQDTVRIGYQPDMTAHLLGTDAVNIKDAYLIPRIDKSLSKLGDANFSTTLDRGSAF